MEERKTTAMVLSILAIIAIYFFVIAPHIKLKKIYHLSYKNCTVNFYYVRQIDTTDDGYVSGQHKLGLCLCEVYKKKNDTAVANKIMNLYRKYGIPISPDTVNYKLDSILKFRRSAFDTLMTVD